MSKREELKIVKQKNSEYVSGLLGRDLSKEEREQLLFFLVEFSIAKSSNLEKNQAKELTMLQAVFEAKKKEASTKSQPPKEHKNNYTPSVSETGVWHAPDVKI